MSKQKVKLSPADREEMERLRMRGDLDGMQDLTLKAWLNSQKAPEVISPLTPEPPKAP